MVSGRGVVVAMDGPSGSGKSSTARGVASRLGLRYLDTGAMYRAMTWWMLENGVDTEDADAVAAHADEPVLVSGTDPENPTITVGETDVAEADPRPGGDVGRQRRERGARDPRAAAA